MTSLFFDGLGFVRSVRTCPVSSSVAAPGRVAVIVTDELVHSGRCGGVGELSKKEIVPARV